MLIYLFILFFFIFFGLQNLCSFAYLLGLMERSISFITSIVQLEFSLLFKEVVVKLLLKHLVCPIFFYFTFLGFLCHQFRFSLSYVFLSLLDEISNDNILSGLSFVSLSCEESYFEGGIAINNVWFEVAFFFF